MSTTTLMTEEEFAALPEGEDFELVEGELVPLSSSNYLHAHVRGELECLLRLYFRGNPIGEVASEIDCRLGPGLVRRPDVAVFLRDKLEAIDEERVPLPFAPDIAVDVLSPSESAMDVNGKTLEYLAGGAREVWVIDHKNRQIFVDTGSGVRRLRGDAVLETPVLPGFSMPVSELLQAHRGSRITIE